MARAAFRHTCDMSQAVALITDRVRDRVRRDGADLTAAGVAERYVLDEVRAYSERALGGSVPLLRDERRAAAAVVAELTGYGSLQPYFDDPTIEEIWINAPDRVFVARHGVPEPTGLELTGSEVRDLVERMLQSSGRRVDLSSPFVDSSLPDGSRLHVVIPDTGDSYIFDCALFDVGRSVPGPAVTAEARVLQSRAYVESKSLSHHCRRHIASEVEAGRLLQLHRRVPASTYSFAKILGRCWRSRHLALKEPIGFFRLGERGEPASGRDRDHRGKQYPLLQKSHSN